MPLLTITSTNPVEPSARVDFFEEVAVMFADTMESQTRFLSITFRAVRRDDVWLGRVEGPNRVHRGR